LVAACSAGAPPASPPIAAASGTIEPPTAAKHAPHTPPDRTASPSSAEQTAPTPEPAAAPADDGKKRITSVGYTSWIRKKPEVKEGEFLGYVRAGSSIALRSETIVRGVGCPGGFYQVEPRGYVCRDRTVTEAPREAWMQAAQASRGSPGTFPYSYAFSNGTPMYNRVPTPAEQARFEKYLGKPGTHAQLPKTLRSHEELAVAEPIAAKDELPSFLLGKGSAREAPYDLVEQTIPLGSMLSYTRSFEAEGRTWLLSADHTIVPADRVRPFKPSTFKGVDLAKDEAKLPLAFMRVKARPKHEKRGDAFVATGEAWPVRTWVELTGARTEAGGKIWLETRERSAGGTAIHIAEEDATVIETETKLPFGLKENQKWFLVRITSGTLVAYQGLRPTYATLVSPGVGGVPVPGRDPVKDSTTPLGTYPITFKDRAATMSPEKGKDRSFWIADVPHTQYFDPPFALHAAYWHERFGELVSAGCVNLSPIDAERLFHWSDPQVPPEWQGATGAGAKENGLASAVVVRR
jgi:hypothetical protein